MAEKRESADGKTDFYEIRGDSKGDSKFRFSIPHYPCKHKGFRGSVTAVTVIFANSLIRVRARRSQEKETRKNNHRR